MKFTLDPRCPAHPRTEVYLVGGTLPTWVCSACRRPLGAASAGNVDGWSFRGPWPPRRKPVAADLAIGVVDWGWFLRRDEREEAA